MTKVKCPIELRVGRMTVFTLYPFCTAEASEGKGNGLDRLLRFDFQRLDDRGISLTKAIRSATYPEIATQSDDGRSLWFDGYITTLLQRDVRMLAELDNGKEVDFVLERPDGSIFAIEVKRSESVDKNDFKGINVLAASTGKDFRAGFVLYTGKEVVPFGENLWAVPLHILWQ